MPTSNVANDRSHTPKGRQTRDRIVSVAEALLAERGFHGTSMRDIAAAAACRSRARFITSRRRSGCTGGPRRDRGRADARARSRDRPGADQR
ncbi:MAG: helix-turn-helix transcriptional regulator [Myxococcales bacterium]|nr:helix-turn-helix transcriptional regulator [Myxococcales bacterium]